MLGSVKTAGRHPLPLPPAHGGNLTENDTMNTPPDITLAALRREFPRYRIWLEPVHGHYRFVARRQHPGTGPHTVITTDPAELRTALTAPGRQEPGPALPCPGAVPATPEDTDADDSDEPRAAALSRPA
jgi:hypothetical protein